MGIFGFLKRKTVGEEGSDPISTIAQEVGDTVRGFSSKEQGTKRLGIDMLSDNRLSKSVRPITIIWILTLFTASLVANWCGLKTDSTYQDLIFWALLACIGFYFPGRDLVKSFAKRRK